MCTLYIVGNSAATIDDFGTPTSVYSCPDDPTWTSALLRVNSRTVGQYDEWNTTLLGPFGKAFFTMNFCIRNKPSKPEFISSSMTFAVRGPFCFYASSCPG
jgi:hypothetical protein